MHTNAKIILYRSCQNFPYTHLFLIFLYSGIFLRYWKMLPLLPSGISSCILQVKISLFLYQESISSTIGNALSIVINKILRAGRRESYGMEENQSTSPTGNLDTLWTTNISQGSALLCAQVINLRLVTFFTR